MNQPTLLTGSEDGRVALVNARTGSVIWQRSSHRQIGTLVHGGDQFFVAWGSRLRLVHGPRYRVRRETWAQEELRRDRIKAEHARLEARFAQDGRLLWRISEWNVAGRLVVGANSDVVVAALAGGYGDLDVHAFDWHTGRPLWTYPYPAHLGYNASRFFVQGGRVAGCRLGHRLLRHQSGRICLAGS